MQCLKCKKKMQTIRTKSEPGKVHRERRCKKCKFTTRTLELPTITIAGEKAEYQERIEKMTDLYEDTLRDLGTYQDVILDLSMLIKKTKA